MNKIITIIVFFAASMYFSVGTIWAQSSIPNLTGKWVSKSYAHHHEKTDFFTNTSLDGQWDIKKQEGRLFYGERSYTMKGGDGSKIKEGFSGAISRDGKRLYLVDHDEDYLFGELLPDGSIELIIMTDGDKNNNSRIGIMEIKRLK
jgi:hypothetical protein